MGILSLFASGESFFDPIFLAMANSLILYPAYRGLKKIIFYPLAKELFYKQSVTRIILLFTAEFTAAQAAYRGSLSVRQRGPGLRLLLVGQRHDQRLH